MTDEPNPDLPPIDFGALGATVAMAQGLADFHRALQSAGFNQTEALLLTTAYLKTMMEAALARQTPSTHHFRPKGG